MRQALYRIYRPKVFSDITGQDNIIKILQKQIEEKTLSHAYLFTGPRGTGKTSTAKVFAKAVNCAGSDKPCYKCEVCKNSDADIIEMDAASNNSVDDIRLMKDNLMFMPSFGKFKVYIIDEVHMLSQGAFNALLKTLEEPPKHVIFILATTEPQKLPATVISRCQRFDFKNIDDLSIKAKLIEVLKKENKDYDDAAVDIIVKKSSGGMRDALSLLDKVSVLEKLDTEKVASLLGDATISDLEELARVFKTKDTHGALNLIDKIESSGKDIKVFLSESNEYFNSMLLKSYEKIKAPFNIEIPEIVMWIEFLSALQNKIKFSQITGSLVRTEFIKLLYLNAGSKNTDFYEMRITDLTRRVRALEEKINSLTISSSDKKTESERIFKDRDACPDTVEDAKQENPAINEDTDIIFKQEDIDTEKDVLNQEDIDTENDVLNQKNIDTENDVLNQEDVDTENDVLNQEDIDTENEVLNQEDIDTENDVLNQEDIDTENDVLNQEDIDTENNVLNQEDVDTEIQDKLESNSSDILKYACTKLNESENFALASLIKKIKPLKIKNGVILFEIPKNDAFAKSLLTKKENIRILENIFSKKTDTEIKVEFTAEKEEPMDIKAQLKTICPNAEIIFVG